MKITISTQTYSNKRESTASVNREVRKQYKQDTGISVKALRWTEVSLSAWDFYQCILQKHIWTTGLYASKVKSKINSSGNITVNIQGTLRPINPFDGNYLRNGFISKEFWCGSYCVFVDIDKTGAKSIEEYVSKFDPRAIPTFGVYSASDTPQDRRFKLVYCFDLPILNDKEWDAISESIHYYIHTNIEPLKDPCGKTRTQISFVGTGQGVWFGNMYDRDVQFAQVITNLYNTSQPDPSPSPSNIPIKNQTAANNVILNQVIVNELKKDLPVKDLRFPYVNRIYRTESEVWWIDGMPWVGLTKTSYWQLRFRRLVNGQERRRTLWKRMCLRRVLKPDATPDEILVNAYMDREDMIDNSDGVVSVDVLIANVKSAFSYTIDEIKDDLKYTIEYLKENAPKMILKKNTWDSGQRNRVFEQARLLLIDMFKNQGLYDTQLSEEKNIETFNQKLEKNGYNLRITSRDTFLKYRKQNNISKDTNSRDKLIMELNAQGNSLAQISEELDLNGYKHMSREGIRKVIKKNTTTP